MTSAWLADCLIGKATDSDAEEKIDNPLMVVGYQCKLFDDAERATEVNSGTSLIPCMNDATLLVDRFDCRSHLWSLNEFDSEKNLKKDVELDASEAELERECDEERYRDLTESADEQESDRSELHSNACLHLSPTVLCTEEATDRGRVQGPYAAVAFSYDETDNDTNGRGESAESSSNADSEEPFRRELLDGVELPDVELPTTLREHVLIRKTAEFVARHGPQMEILIKMKRTAQADKLAFLDFEHRLNPYYKAIVKLLRDGVLKDQSDSPRPPVSETDQSTSLPQIQSPASDARTESESSTAVKEQTAVAADWLEKLPKVSTQGTAYAKLMEQFRGDAQPRPSAVTSFDTHYSYLYAQYYAYFSTLQANALNCASVPPAPPLVQTASEASVPASEPAQSDTPTPPSMDLRSLIDKTAEYVARNGEDFEKLLVEREMAKGDARFAFLQPGNWLHAYFRERVHAFRLACTMRAQLEGKRPVVNAAVKLSPPKLVEKSGDQKMAGNLPSSNSLANLVQHYGSDEEDESDPSEPSHNEELRKEATEDDGGLHTIAEPPAPENDSPAPRDDRQLSAFLDELEHVPVPSVCDAKREERKRRAAHFLANINSNRIEHDSERSPTHSPSDARPSQSRPHSRSRSRSRSRSVSRSRSKRHSVSRSPQRVKKRSPTPKRKRSRRRSRSRSGSARERTRERERERTRSPSRSRSRSRSRGRSRSRSRRRQREQRERQHRHHRRRHEREERHRREGHRSSKKVKRRRSSSSDSR